ncbi:hypothetical protein RSSM_04873 [Rhodopirellula sallentina SM41]|uniref:Uncharacterized protein n=1 Tax=Rhodopirellula sallentina SM41 TaxID=1263870 RepID=M5TX04_9BACT|nr:hypothetical protein RSSM_04873 [Rhodopirellula sallentina SM41]
MSVTSNAIVQNQEKRFVCQSRDNASAEQERIKNDRFCSLNSRRTAKGKSPWPEIGQPRHRGNFSKNAFRNAGRGNEPPYTNCY